MLTSLIFALATTVPTALAQDSGICITSANVPDTVAQAIEIIGADLVSSRSLSFGSGRFTALAFDQTINGFPVENARARIVFDNSFGQVVLVTALVAPEPAAQAQILFTDRDASLAAAGWAQIDQPQLIYFWDQSHEPTLTWRVSVNNQDKANFEGQSFYFDVQTGQLVHAKNDVISCGPIKPLKGNISAMATPGTLPDIDKNPQTLQGAANIFLTDGVRTIIEADHAGDYVLDFRDPLNLSAQLKSRWVSVIDTDGNNLKLTQMVPPDMDFVLGDLSEFQTAQINAFIGTNASHDFYTERSRWKDLDYQIPATVNIDAACNAFYYNNTINFFRQNGSCVNTAYSTVVAHEYGHFVVNQLGLTQAAFGEGYSDALAIMIFKTHILGEHFVITGGDVRNVRDDVVTFPCSGGFHRCGMVLGGIWCNIIDGYRNSYGDETGTALARQLFVDWSLVTLGAGWTRDSANPYTAYEIQTIGNPDDEAIFKEAFERHGIAWPPCLADLDFDGVADSVDFLLFLDWYSTGDARADFNHDATIDARDFLAFLNAFNSPC